MYNIMMRYRLGNIEAGAENIARSFESVPQVDVTGIANVVDKITDSAVKNATLSAQLKIDKYVSRLNSEITRSGTYIDENVYNALKKQTNDFFTSLYNEYSSADLQSLSKQEAGILDNIDTASAKSAAAHQLFLSTKVLSAQDKNFTELESALNSDVGLKAKTTMNNMVGDEQTFNYIESQKKIAFKNSVLDPFVRMDTLIKNGASINIPRDQVENARKKVNIERYNTFFESINVDEMTLQNPFALGVTQDIDDIASSYGGYDINLGVSNYVDKVNNSTDPPELKKAKKDVALAYNNRVIGMLNTNPLDFAISRNFLTPFGLNQYSPYSVGLSRIDGLKKIMDWGAASANVSPFTQSELARIRANDPTILNNVQVMLDALDDRDITDQRIKNLMINTLSTENSNLINFLNDPEGYKNYIEVNNQYNRLFVGRVDIDKLANSSFTPPILEYLPDSSVALGAFLQNKKLRQVRSLYDKSQNFRDAYKFGIKAYLVAHNMDVKTLKDFTASTDDIMKYANIDINEDSRVFGGWYYSAKNALFQAPDPRSFIPKQKTGIQGMYYKFFDNRDFKYKQISRDVYTVVDADGNKILNDLTGLPYYATQYGTISEGNNGLN